MATVLGMSVIIAAYNRARAVRFSLCEPRPFDSARGRPEPVEGRARRGVSSNRRLSLATLLLLSFFTFFLGLGRQAITDADEAYYAEASREMVESGDWLTPRFNYQNRWEKPVLYYWLTSATYLVTGPTEFSARLWSALSGVGLVLLAWAIARQMTGRLDVGLA